MDAVNPLYAEANQLRWILQLLLTATLAAAFFVLSHRLRRPLMGAFAALWGLQAVLAHNNLWFWWNLAAVAGRPWLEVSSNALDGLLYGLSVPIILYATTLLIEGESARRPSREAVLGWGAALSVVSVITTLVAMWLPVAVDPIRALSGRLLYLVPWAAAIGLAYRTTARPWPVALRAFTIACWLQVGRMAADAVLRLAPWPEELAAVATGVTVFGHVLVILCVGLITMFVSLEHERQLVLRQAALLDAARVREARADRMSSLGRFASGVAHDFNNVLTVIVSAVELAQGDAGLGPKARARVEAIRSAAERGAGLVRQLLDFARDRPAEVTRFAPADALRRLDTLLERLAGRDVRVRWMLDGAGEVEMDVSAFERVVMNLVSNARDAMPDGGDLWVALEDDDFSVAGDGTRAAGGYVRLSVTDTGVGMPSELLPRIFEPFITTKEATGGTGLGLANVERIVQDAGGWVTVDSTLGAGTRFDVWLPAARPGRGGE